MQILSNRTLASVNCCDLAVVLISQALPLMQQISCFTVGTSSRVRIILTSVCEIDEICCYSVQKRQCFRLQGNLECRSSK
jgi:hypothetical protein